MKRKFLIILLIALLVSFINLNQSYDGGNMKNLAPLSIKENDNTSILIGTGEICPIYEPKGEVVYNSEWTGDLPEIDKVTSDYETATFGLG